MEIPYRKVQTPWGALYATPIDDGVRFSTRSPRPDEPDTELLLEWRYYTCELDITSGEAGGRVPVDDTWHFSPRQAAENLVRLPHGGTTPLADHGAFQRQVVPELVKWLHSPAAHSLFKASRKHSRTARIEQAWDAAQILHQATDRARSILAEVASGRDLSSDDHRFLTFITQDLTRVMKGDLDPQRQPPDDPPAPPQPARHPDPPPPEARGL